MMAVLMDENKESSCRERVQRLFDKNVDLENKRRKAAQSRIPSDPNSWQQMRDNYETIILEDHAFSEKHEIEYALWQLHYRRIDELRAVLNATLSSSASQNGKGPIRPGPDRITKIRSQFKNFLSEASGFYHDLVLKIRSKHGLPLGQFYDDVDNQNPMAKDGTKSSSEVKNALTSCHRCLIYLGDLARYKVLYGEGDSKSWDFAAASSYYMQASSLWPSSGNPHHQLAIVSGYSNDELVSIYRYFRSLAVENPFTTARENLIIAFEKNRQNYTQLLGDAKATSVKTAPSRFPGKGRGKGETRNTSKDNKTESISVKERASNIPELFKAFCTRFVRLNGILFTRTSLETFAEVFSLVRNDLLELLSSGPLEDYNFGPGPAESKLAIVRLISILIYTVHNVNKESDNQSYADILQRSVLLQNAFSSIFEFTGHIFERCSQLNDPSSSYLLPGIMVFIEWLACCPDIAAASELDEKKQSFLWNKCVAFLNKLLSSGYKFDNEGGDETCFSNMAKYDEDETFNRLALPEDFELRGFVPLLPAQLILDFSSKRSFGDKEKIARLQRIIAAAKALASVIQVGKEGRLYFDSRSKKFAIGVEPQMDDDDYLLSGPPEVPNLAPGPLDVSIGGQIESEDEDEVIVFKPFTTGKHMDEASSQSISFKVTAPIGYENGSFSVGHGDGSVYVGPGKHISEASSESIPSKVTAPVGYENGSFSVGHGDGSFYAGPDSFNVQNASVRPSSTVFNSTSQYLQQPVQPVASNWLADQAAPLVNELSELNLMNNRLAPKPEFLDPFFSTGTTTGYLNHLPSFFDSVKSPAIPLKKNPVSRPVRHLGPPPGFNSLPSKAVDESLEVKNEYPPTPQMNDYRWMDGYHFPLSNQSVAPINSRNQVGPVFHSTSRSNNGSMGMTNSFPFPGKQISTPQVQSANQRGWNGNNQFAEQMKLFEEQQQQLQNGNQQSLWEGRSYV